MQNISWFLLISYQILAIQNCYFLHPLHKNDLVMYLSNEIDLTSIWHFLYKTHLIPFYFSVTYFFLDNINLNVVYCQMKYVQQYWYIVRKWWCKVSPPLSKKKDNVRTKSLKCFSLHCLDIVLTLLLNIQNIDQDLEQDTKNWLLVGMTMSGNYQHNVEIF